MSIGRRRELVEADHPQLSITRQCELVSISRSSYYGLAKGEPAANLELMRLIDGQFLETPWYGSRQMTRHLRRRASRRVLAWRLSNTMDVEFCIEARAGIGRWIDYYNADRPHSALGGRTPDEAYQGPSDRIRLAA